MGRLHIQQALDAGITEAELSDKYGVTTRHGVKYPNIVSLKYDMVGVAVLGTGGHPLVRECRGLVLDTADSNRIVSRAFDRFYNADDPMADEIDWKTAKVLTKEDGSLILCSWYRDGWLVSSSGSPEAGGEVSGWGLSFADYFWHTLDSNGYELPAQDCGITLIFELVGPKNRIVVDHKTSDLVLLGARDLRTQVEISPRDAASLYMPTARVVTEHAFQSPADIAKALDALNPMEAEGFVVVDGRFHRQKHKSLAYVRWHRAKEATNPRSLFEIARNGETSEIEQSFSELKEQLDVYRAKIDDWCDEVELDFHRLKDIPVQKDFAHAALTTLCSSALFAIRAGKARTAREFLGKVSLDTAMGWLGIRTAG